MPTLNAPRLIANTLPRRGRASFSPVRRTLDHAAADSKAPSQSRDASRDPFRITDRALDHVVDRLLAELTW